ncbi:MAG TPA: hypothetical protein VGN09_11355, partial [Vicinamibacteria bacterium]
MNAPLGVLLTLLAAPPSAAAPARAVDAATLPFALTEGWEAFDGDASDPRTLEGLAWRPADPLREPGPHDSIRWYRIRLDFAGCRGLPLAFYVPAIRDVDETYLDGVRIGGTGSFPPRPKLATIQRRLYRLPANLTDHAGVRTLAIRVYQGPSATPVFRFAPQVDEVALTRRRSWLDQALTGHTGHQAWHRQGGLGDRPRLERA